MRRDQPCAAHRPPGRRVVRTQGRAMTVTIYPPTYGHESLSGHQVCPVAAVRGNTAIRQHGPRNVAAAPKSRHKPQGCSLKATS